MASKLYQSLDTCPTWIPAKPNGDGDVALQTLPGGASKLKLGPGKKVIISISIAPFHLPPLKPGIIDLHDLWFSTRSCLAQSGVFLNIPKNSYLSNTDWETLRTGNNIIKSAQLENFSHNTLIFNPGDHIGRFFHLNENDRLNQTQLMELVDNGSFPGIEDDDYRLCSINGEPFISLRVDPNEISLTSGETIRITSRQEIYQHTSSVLSSSNGDFHLLQTTIPVKLPKNIIGVISTVMAPSTLTHLKSQLLDPGTSWKIRLETLGHSTNFDNVWIFIALYRSPLLDFNTHMSISTYSFCLLSTSI